MPMTPQVPRVGCGAGEKGATGKREGSWKNYFMQPHKFIVKPCSVSSFQKLNNNC